MSTNEIYAVRFNFVRIGHDKSSSLFSIHLYSHPTQVSHTVVQSVAFPELCNTTISRHIFKECNTKTRYKMTHDNSEDTCY